MSDHTRRSRIAIAEGHPAFRAALACALEHAGCAVASCADAGALDRALADHTSAVHRLDALVIDVGLPDAEGLDALGALGIFGAHVPLLIMASESTPALERSAIARGATLVVDKRERGVDGVVRALRYLVGRNARWSGEWISTGLLERLRKSAS